MTLDEMSAEIIEAWTGNDPEMVALWDRNRLFDRAEALARRVRAEARENGTPERMVLMDRLGMFRLPGVPGDGELA